MVVMVARTGDGSSTCNSFQLYSRCVRGSGEVILHALYPALADAAMAGFDDIFLASALSLLRETPCSRSFVFACNEKERSSNLARTSAKLCSNTSSYLRNRDRFNLHRAF